MTTSSRVVIGGQSEVEKISMNTAQINRWHVLNWLAFAAEEHAFARKAKANSVARYYHKTEMRRCLRVAKACRMLPASE